MAVRANATSAPDGFCRGRLCAARCIVADVLVHGPRANSDHLCGSEEVGTVVEGLRPSIFRS